MTVLKLYRHGTETVPSWIFVFFLQKTLPKFTP
jgi:hypothetical protein